MRAIAHGWTPSRMKSPPSRAVAQEFVDADRKYSGGFAENRYWVGGLASMNEPNAGYKGRLDWQEGGDVDPQLRQRSENILGSARGGHVNYYQAGGTIRPGHAEGPNPFEGKGKPAQYNLWESENHIDPPPPPEVAEEVEEEGGVAQWLRSLFTPDPEKAIGSGEARGTIEEQMEAEGQAYGGRVGYQAGGLAVAAPGRILPPAGGVPPWIEPVGSGPGFREEEVPGYQFGGMAARMGPAMRMARGIRGGGGQYRGVPPQRGGLHPGAQGPRGGGLAAMMRQAQQQRGGLHPGAQGPGGGFLSRFAQQSPGQPLHPGAQGPGGGGFLSRFRQMAEQQRGQQPGGGMPGGGIMSREEAQRRAEAAGPRPEGPRYPPGYNNEAGIAMGPIEGLPPMRSPGDVIYDGGDWQNPRIPRGPMAPGGGPIQLPPNYDPRIRTGPNPNIGRPGYDPIGDMGPITGGGRRPWKQPGRRIAPPPGKEPGGGGIIGGARVPPNMQGFLQRMRMQNRPPTGPGGGGGNRVGMADQQGAYARATQRGTGRAPMSRRMGFGRAGRRR